MFIGHILCAKYCASLKKYSDKQTRHHPYPVWVDGHKLRNHIYEYIIAMLAKTYRQVTGDCDTDIIQANSYLNYSFCSAMPPKPLFTK